jgi:hypothetical protein
MPGKGSLSLRSLIPAPRALELRSSRNLGERLLARARQHGLTSEQQLGIPQYESRLAKTARSKSIWPCYRDDRQ